MSCKVLVASTTRWSSVTWIADNESGSNLTRLTFHDNHHIPQPAPTTRKFLCWSSLRQDNKQAQIIPMTLCCSTQATKQARTSNIFRKYRVKFYVAASNCVQKSWYCLDHGTALIQSPMLASFWIWMLIAAAREFQSNGRRVRYGSQQSQQWSHSANTQRNPTMSCKSATSSNPNSYVWKLTSKIATERAAGDLTVGSWTI